MTAACFGVLVDIEATELLVPDVAPLHQQPYMAEICLRKIDAAGATLDEYVTRVKPPVPVPVIFTKITSLTDADLASAPSFTRILPELQRFLLGVGHLIAHNVAYDRGVLRAELERLGMVTNFPWPPTHWCTVEQTQHLTGKHLKLSELFTLLTGTEPSQVHRASEDVDLLQTCVVELLKKGLLWQPSASSSARARPTAPIAAKSSTQAPKRSSPTKRLAPPGIGGASGKKRSTSSTRTAPKSTS